MPIYVLRANTVSQMEQFLMDLYNLPGERVMASRRTRSRQQTQPRSRPCSTASASGYAPGPSLVRRIQHEMARAAELVSHSYGKEPSRHVRIFRESNKTANRQISDQTIERLICLFILFPMGTGKQGTSKFIAQIVGVLSGLISIFRWYCSVGLWFFQRT